MRLIPYSDFSDCLRTACTPHYTRHKKPRKGSRHRVHLHQQHLDVGSDAPLLCRTNNFVLQKSKHAIHTSSGQSGIACPITSNCSRPDRDRPYDSRNHVCTAEPVCEVFVPKAISLSIVSPQSASVPVGSGYLVNVALSPSRAATRPPGLQRRRISRTAATGSGMWRRSLVRQDDVEAGLAEGEAVEDVDSLKTQVC